MICVNIPNSSLREISYEEIKDLEFRDSSIVEDVNKWAVKYGFHMRSTEGLKKLNMRWGGTLKCSEKKCNYKLYFISQSKEEGFSLYGELGIKYKSHSKALLFFFYLTLLL